MAVTVTIATTIVSFSLQHFFLSLPPDSYGSNVVLQLRGHKRWLLWAPTAQNLSDLGARRVPYEESSIYAEHDPRRDQSQDRPRPPDMTLEMEEGDVLLLPKHWWHYVSVQFAARGN